MRPVRWFFMASALGMLVSVPVSAQRDGEVISSRGPRFLVATTARAKPVVASPATIPVLARQIALNLRGVAIDTALTIIAKQAGLQLVYGEDLLPLGGRVRLKAEEISVAAALTSVLLDTGIDIVFSAGNRATLIARASLSSTMAPGTIVGRIMDSTRMGIRGVEVYLENTRWRTTSDSSGVYQLTGVDTGRYQITARRIGYSRQTKQVVVRAAQVDTINFFLVSAAVGLDELVTTATGQQRRRDLGNAITTIRADSVMQTAPIRSLTDLLDGRVPGLTVQHTSGAPGDPARIRLRGLGSVTRGNDPVFIVDGVRVYSAQADPRSGNLTNLGCANPKVAQQGNVSGCNSPQLPGTAGNIPAPSPLDQIDPNTIEKIEVFKGPSAATLYGADAANGVIVITTKRGKAGPTRWNASVTHSRTVQPGRYPAGYYRWGHDSLGGMLGICPIQFTQCIQDSLVRQQALNDPATTLFGRGSSTVLSLTAAGGSQALLYSITGTYDNETGLLKLPDFEVERFRATYNREVPDWMRKPHHHSRWSVQSSVTALLGPTADVTLTTTVARTEQERTPLEDKAPIFAGTYVDRVNSLYYPTAGAGRGGLFLSEQGAHNAAFLKDYYTKTTASALSLTTGLGANWRPLRWVRLLGQAGIDVKPRNDQRFLAPGYPTPADSGLLVSGAGRAVTGTFNLQGTMTRALPWGFRFETNVGANIVSQNTEDIISSASGLQPGTSSQAGARYTTATDGRVSNSVFGWYIEPRFVGQRLSLSTGIRLDGGSTYGTRLKGNGLISLPKLNGSWVISEEPWFPFSSLFSSLRLRGAYGQAQVQPGAVDRLRIYAGRVENALRLQSVGNSQLRPERSVEFEGGFDADILDSRVSLEVTAYQKKQIDALMSVTLPPSVNGGGTFMQNVGNILNRGVEVSVQMRPVQSRLLTWTASLLYSRNTNTLVKLGDGVLANKAIGLVEGYPVTGRWARPILGYADVDNSGVIGYDDIQIGDSLVYMGQLMPDYTTTLFSNAALFGGAVTVSASFDYESGATQVDRTLDNNWVLVRGLADPSSSFGEQAAVVGSLARADGNSTDYGLIQDVSTFRFNTFSVNYRVPRGVARMLRAQELTVAVQGSNLGMHSTYRGKDPDVNSWSPGENIVDSGQIPQPRRWQLALFLRY